MTIEILDRLYESGELRSLVRAGLISVNANVYRNIFHAYKFRVDNGAKSSQAITDVADMFKLSDRTVYRIIKQMKEKH
jgi:hypothetical protein